MADSPLTLSDIAQTDNETSYSIGDLRRTYAFSSNRLSKLLIPQDPLFRILAAKRNQPVSDPVFKITEERPFMYKRYAYAVAFKVWSGSGDVPITGYTADDDLVGGSLTPQTQGTYMALQFKTDYESSGLRQNVYGQASTKISIGATGTCPSFFLENQIIKICTKSDTADLVADDFFTLRIMSVRTSSQSAYVGGVVVKALGAAANKYLCSYPAGAVVTDTYTYAMGHDVAGTKPILETMRTYVVGNAYARGSGLPETYNTKPFYTRYGMTMIQKQSLSMDNTTRATETKIYTNEWARLWAEKVRLHKYDIANEIYFSDLYEETSGITHTQGIVPWCLNYGNIFSLTTAKTQDSFLEDMSTLNDPRYNGINNYLFVVPTYYWNWLHKLAGYSLNNLKLGISSSAATYVYNFDKAGPRKLAGVNLFEFSTDLGSMYVLLDRHLDGTHVKMLGIPMNAIVYRPLVGNGRNRDTTIYEGVQQIANTGVDAYVNLIQTEFGLEPSLPESWAIWT